MLGGSESFFLTSSAQALCMILLNTFWSVIFFDGFDRQNIPQIAYVLVSHFVVSSLTLLNAQGFHILTLATSYFFTLITAILAMKVVGGTAQSVKRFITCQ